MSHNYSLYGLPAYYTLAMIPHLCSIVLVSTNKQKWDNASPRSDKFVTSLKKSIPPKALAQYERCRAAHSNMLSENMAFFVGAVLAGNISGLEAGFLNRLTGWYLASRVAYLICYIYIGRQKYSWIRTAAFNAGCAVLFRIYFAAAAAMSKKPVV